jgi:mannose-6-phosphate isomerase-like protein (cupin superfamily)
MARILGTDAAQGRADLESAGVLVGVVDDETQDVEESVLAAVLPEEVRAIRGEMVASPPPDAEADTGMGAWHRNDVDELHVVTAGEGIMEFITEAGVVSVVVEPGDVVEIHRAEHRYRPLTDQSWVIRHAAAPGADMQATPTGRDAQAWPDVTPR